MRRGFAGILAALVFATLLFHSAVLKKNSADAVSKSRASVLFLEKAYYDEISFKDSLASLLAHASGTSRENRAAFIAGKLPEWQQGLEQFFENNGASASIWWGFAGEAEIKGIKSKALASRLPEKCNCCWDFAQPEGETLPAWTTLLDYDSLKGEMKISNRANTTTIFPKCADESAPGTSQPAVFGATLFYRVQNVSAVFVAREGFAARTIELDSQGEREAP